MPKQNIAVLLKNTDEALEQMPQSPSITQTFNSDIEHQIKLYQDQMAREDAESRVCEESADDHIQKARESLRQAREARRRKFECQDTIRALMAVRDLQ